MYLWVFSAQEAWQRNKQSIRSFYLCKAPCGTYTLDKMTGPLGDPEARGLPRAELWHRVWILRLHRDIWERRLLIHAHSAHLFILLYWHAFGRILNVFSGFRCQEMHFNRLRIRQSQTCWMVFSCQQTMKTSILDQKFSWRNTNKALVHSRAEVV